jgi:hypothetical protein
MLPGKTAGERLTNVVSYLLKEMDLNSSGKITKIAFVTQWKACHARLFDLVNSVEKVENNPLACNIM